MADTHQLEYSPVCAPRLKRSRSEIDFEEANVDMKAVWKPYQSAPRTPPASRPSSSGAIHHASPDPRPYRSPYTSVSQLRTPSPAVDNASLPSPVVRLPSMQEFEQGVEKLVKFYGDSTATSLPSLATSASLAPSFSTSSSSPLMPSTPLTPPSSHSGSVFQFHGHSPSPLPPTKALNESHYFAQHGLGSFPAYPRPTSVAGYSSQSLDANQRHINKKYKTEEGDYIIYAIHDKKLKWETVRLNFAKRFGSTPERTTSGLQAWYYRENNMIPLWNEDGYLEYDNEDADEPKMRAVKCRQNNIPEGLGLAQRFPERLITYPWVDEACRSKAQDWAAKRRWQMQDRAQRRKKKELFLSKL